MLRRPRRSSSASANRPAPPRSATARIRAFRPEPRRLSDRLTAGCSKDTTSEMLSREEEMAMLRWLKPTLAGVVLAIAGSSAHAQGTKDTVRVAVYQPVPIIDVIYNPSPETSLVANIVFDSLVYFDAAKREYVPLLA